MKKFKSVYPFEVIDKIKGGKLVYFVDKSERNTRCVNDMSVDDFVCVLSYDSRDGRFDFWIEEGTEETDE